MILTQPFILRFLVAAISGLNRSLEKVRDSHQKQVRKNIDRITQLTLENISRERESRRANSIAAKLRSVIEA